MNQSGVAAVSLATALFIIASVLFVLHVVFQHTTQYHLVTTYVSIDATKWVVGNTVSEFKGSEPSDFYTSIAEGLAVKHGVPAGQVTFINVKPISRQQFEAFRDMWARDALKGKEP